MSFFEFLYRNGLWISVPLFAAGIILLVSFIKNVIRGQREAEILSVPLVENQSVEFGDAGRVVLCMEGPLFTSRFSGTDFQLCAGDGTVVPGRSALFRAKSSTLSRVRMEMKVYEISMPGSYVLRILNLGAPQPKDHKHQIVFMKPHLAQMIVYTVGIVLSSMLCIGSLVLFLLRILSVDAGA